MDFGGISTSGDYWQQNYEQSCTLIFMWNQVLLLLAKFWGVGLMSPMVTLCSDFWGCFKLIFKAAAPLLRWTMLESPIYFTSEPIFVICLLDCSHACRFGFSWWMIMCSIFSLAYLLLHLFICTSRLTFVDLAYHDVSIRAYKFQHSSQCEQNSFWSYCACLKLAAFIGPEQSRILSPMPDP